MIRHNLRDPARSLFPDRRAPGMMLVLEAYFDDSGTHDGSRMLVWGGIVGAVENFEYLDKAWCAVLAEPVPGKPALRQFHLTACVNGRGAFDGYSQAERDLARNCFRAAIIESGVVPIAIGIDVAEWDAQVVGELRVRMGGAERCAFGLCAKEALRIAAAHEKTMSVHFDKGRMSVGLDLMLQGARELVPDGDSFVSFAFSDVAAFTGLQAADSISYEVYQFGLRWLDDRSAEPEPHLKHFLVNIEANTRFGMMGAAEITELVSKMALGE